MIEFSRPEEDSESGNRYDFRQVFITRVHEVLEQGYRCLFPATLATAEEPDITGELVIAMTSFLRGPAAPDWADYLSVHDDPPVHGGSRRGKRRSRLDIRVDSSRPRPGASFSFEAKRLGPAHPASYYVGEEGIGRFLRGQYARNDDDAGMLGYMQSHDAEYWRDEIKEALEDDHELYGLSGTGWWTKHTIPAGPLHMFLTDHMRRAPVRMIKLYHTLLSFLDPPSGQA